MSEIPTRDLTWINAAVDRFEKAWRAGPRLRIEDELIAVEEPRRARLLEELLRVERELRQAGGEEPTREEYHRRFPEHAAVVDTVFDAGGQTHSASTQSVIEGAASDSPSVIRSTLDGLAETIGSVPRVRLPETRVEAETLVVRPSPPQRAQATGRYQLLGSIGHGGMGAVLKGRDPDLGRDLAIKVLLEEHHDHPEMVRRFVEEAQIGGQLQHPGIVPVYELGAFGESRPYFTMKLVQGRTLSALLTERADPTQDQPRLLGIFEQVCQTIAYAHARGVIHRDLKPSNIMVGAFGEVQVMDWGLAKVLPQSGTTDEPKDRGDAAAIRVIRTVRSSSDVDASRAGSVLGTPAYMAPEQARGDIAMIDERADVFGLGSILCEILTGRPAFRGPSAQAVLRQAMRGETADALHRLEGCRADAELVALARDCLAVDPQERPAHAGELAEAVTAYLTGVQEKLRQAELDRVEAQARAEEEIKRRALADELAREAQARAEEEANGRELADRLARAAEARAVEERQRRRITLGLAASILALAGLGGATWLVGERLRAGRRAAVAQVLDEAQRLQLIARAAAADAPSRWAEALAVMERADGLLAQGGAADQLREASALKDAITRDRDAARREDDWMARLTDIRSGRADDGSGSATESESAAIFREAGIDLDVASPATVAARLRSFRPALAQAMIATLDDWSDVRWRLRKDRTGASRLLEAAQAADPDAWRNRLRAAFSLTEPAKKLAAFRELARTARYDELPAISLDHLGNALIWSGDRQAGSDLLRAAVRIHPRDVWLNYDLAVSLERLGKTREAIRFYMAARALRPETAHELAHALENAGETDEAIAVFQDLARLRPKNGRHLYCLGNACQARGRTREADQALEAAVTVLRETIRLQPQDFRAFSLLGLARNAQGKRSEAIAAYREAIRLQPNVAYVHNNLGLALSAQGKLDEAIAEYRTAIRLQPDDPSAHNLLGIALRGQGKVDEALAAYRAAIRLAPDHAVAHNNLGYALAKQGKLDEAIAEYRTAIRLKPDLAYAHGNLIIALNDQGRFDEAFAAFRAATHLLPDSAMPHNSLAWALVVRPKRPQRDYDEGLVHARKAAELAPKVADYLGTLALAEYRSGHWAESIAASHRAMALRNGRGAYDWFLLAMAHGQKGEKDQARRWFDKAVAWTKEKEPKHKEILQLWAEAAAVLGRPGPDATGLGSPAGPATAKPR